MNASAEHVQREELLPQFSPSRDFALDCDAADILAPYRRQFELPMHANGQPLIYLCGHSLGLAPRAALDVVSEELAEWAALGVSGHHTATRPWIDYAANFTKGLQHVTGALASEVVAMNSLTVNLHLMMASFYRPVGMRDKVLIEDGAFSSDRHAVLGQIGWHKLDPDETLVELRPRDGEETIRVEDIEAKIAELGPELALVLWPGVQYRTGQAFDLKEIARLGHAAGAVVGFDLAHAVGNLPLQWHDSGADFAVWCHYKYMNSGPGAVAGCFVHERHARTQRPRFAGWWGNDQAVRFRMGPEFNPTPGADGWQLSNPPILGLAPLRASLDQFERATMPALRAKSQTLTGYLEALIDADLRDVLQVVTPRDAAQRGCQLSIRVIGGRERGRALFDFLAARGVLGDWREPDVIRISPVPLYNTHADVLRFARTVREWRDAR